MATTFRTYAAKIGIKDIPFGSLTVEHVIESPEGKEVIRLLKMVSDDPETLIGPFLVSYQFFDLKYQLMEMGTFIGQPTPDDNEQLLKLATINVVENLSGILNGLGQERLNKIIEKLSPETTQ